MRVLVAGRVVPQSHGSSDGARQGGWVATEDDPLEMTEGTRALVHLERAVTDAGGVVLRYGAFTGRGPTSSRSHWCASACCRSGGHRVHLVGPRRRRGERHGPGGGAGAHGRLQHGSHRVLAGDMAVGMMTEGRGFSNAEAKRELRWVLRYPSWREGFTEELA